MPPRRFVDARPATGRRPTLFLGAPVRPARRPTPMPRLPVHAAPDSGPPTTPAPTLNAVSPRPPHQRLPTRRVMRLVVAALASALALAAAAQAAEPGPAPRQGQSAVTNRRAGWRAPAGGCVAPVPPQPNYAYVSNRIPPSSGRGYVSICPVSGNTTLGACTTSFGSRTFELPGGVAVSSGTYLYVADSSTVSICPITAADGSLGACTVTTANDGGGASTLSGPTGLAISGGYLYITNQVSSRVSICPLLHGGALGPCTSGTGNGLFSAPNGIAISGASAWVTNFANTKAVVVCPIEAGGALGTCTPAAPDGVFFEPAGIAVSGGYAYVTFGGSTSTVATVCTVALNGALTNCGYRYGFNDPSGVAIFNNYAWITNLGDNTVLACGPLEGSALGTCTTASSDASFDVPFGIAFMSSG